ncbi:MAG: undecaprenyl-phosphate glucose phosphotransferase [Xanthobacteraceae bacterium]|nr:undecaprenyl-phosphate glucose phosphotransferase [Xanthobacteraceae bacterium]
MSLGSEIRGDARQAAHLREPSIFSGDSIPYLLAMSDALVILLSSVLGGFVYQAFIGNPATDLIPYCAVGLLASFVYILRMSGAGHYDFPECARPRVEFNDILLCWLTTGLLLAFFAFLLKIGVEYSRGAFVVFYFVASVGLLGVRKATKGALTSAVARGAFARRDILLIGDADEVAALGAQDMLTMFGAADVSRFTLSRARDPAQRAADDERVLGAAIQFARANHCQEIVLALPWVATDRIDFVRDAIKVLPVAARLLPDIRVRSLTSYASSARQRVVAIEVQRAPLSATEQAAKRTMDVVVASAALIVLLPVMGLAAVAIKLDSAGPVIFRQRRKGFNGREFVMFKFRSMTVQEDGAVVSQATRNDPRVTAIGKVLRASSVDELPQLVNVLRGDMSLIGPRPHALAHDDYFQNIVSDYAFRHHMKPGLTGWAQCNGSRGATPSVEHVSERVKLDLWYINNWSLWLDVQILFKTCFEVLRKRNAY